MSQRGSEGWRAVRLARGVAVQETEQPSLGSGLLWTPWVVPRGFGEVRLGLVTESGGGPRSWCEQGA